ncbi:MULTISPECIES: hypothetical protein [unclassified Rhizobium]|uniref:hypothetical protein n=1 Tax=unclassified Rhizobium TaxID=2613769 RepID=UPI00146EAA2A|nr:MULTISPECIES: hypothetical protein [unclassified Rhizobium]MBD9450379.1 hypothetical protein [Rhizobium sp. RHZ02]NMN71825.1 hypothetical protein [Rhizobium sp. 57MFTsu3.2]
MPKDSENNDLDLRTTPRRYRNRGWVWLLIAILVLLLVLAYGVSELRSALGISYAHSTSHTEVTNNAQA